MNRASNEHSCDIKHLSFVETAARTHNIKIKRNKKSSPNTFCGLRPSARWLVAVSEALRRVINSQPTK